MARPGTRMEIRSHGSRVGWLNITKGFIGWKPANKQTYRKLSWTKFDKLMREHA